MTSRLRTLLPAGLLVAGLLVAPSTVEAQALGIHGGVTAHQFSIETAAPPTQSLWGGAGGIFVLLGEGVFGGIVEANWVRKGTKFDGGSEVRLDYLEIPLAARLVFGSGQDLSLHALFGGTLAFKLKASQSGIPAFEDLDEDVDTFDHGALLGAGLEYRNLIASGRYVWGTRDISARSIEAYNRGFTFLVGYKLLGGQ
ncbi:MAG TPA: porin family protein [Vicinamibacterales bacterium]|nr:porin family protein [Vicinamibacterales bacterium]